jgi:molybdopterin-binding protein
VAANQLKPREAAAAIGVSYPTLKQWIYQRRIHASKTPGGHYRIPESEVNRIRGEAGRPVPQAGLRVSGRNQLHGTVVAIKREGLLAAVTLAIGDQRIQAVITAEAADELGLQVGAPAIALIKATEVMIMK